MSWFATDDRFWSHSKVMRLRRSPYYTSALTLWLLAGSWCSGQTKEQYTGRIPLDVLASFGVADWEEATNALIAAGLWEDLDDDAVSFHDWDNWNGTNAQHNRSKEQTRLRVERHRLAKCQRGDHDRHCPIGCPVRIARRQKCEGGKHDRYCPADICPVKLERPTGNGGKRYPGTGRDGTGSPNGSPVRPTGKERQQGQEGDHTNARDARTDDAGGTWGEHIVGGKKW